MDLIGLGSLVFAFIAAVAGIYAILPILAPLVRVDIGMTGSGAGMGTERYRSTLLVAVTNKSATVAIGHSLLAIEVENTCRRWRLLEPRWLQWCEAEMNDIDPGDLRLLDADSFRATSFEDFLVRRLPCVLAVEPATSAYYDYHRVLRDGPIRMRATLRYKAGIRWGVTSRARAFRAFTPRIESTVGRPDKLVQWLV